MLMSRSFVRRCAMMVLEFESTLGEISKGRVAIVIRENPYFLSSMAHRSGMLR